MKRPGSFCLAALAISLSTMNVACAQLLGEPPIASKQTKEQTREQKKDKRRQQADLEWMWQYSPPPADGRERELFQDAHFRPFLERYFTAPQSFWGPQADKTRKSLPDTVEDFLAIPAQVIADDNRYITITGAVRRRPTSRGLIFADLNNPHPLVVFAAIDWTRDGKTTEEADAPYTLWLFVNQPPGPPTAAQSLPPALERSLARWIAKPLAGSGIVEKITSAILVDPDGTPHQIPVPNGSAQ